jgi:hypothetical protein
MTHPITLGKYHDERWAKTWRYILRHCSGWDYLIALTLLGYTPDMVDRWISGIAPQPDDLSLEQSARINKLVEVLNAKMTRAYWTIAGGRRYEWRDDKKMVEVPWPMADEHPGDVAPIADFEVFRRKHVAKR